MRQRAFWTFTALFMAFLAVSAVAKGPPNPFKDFDELFDDRFFYRRQDPFAEMLEFQKRLDSELGKREKILFGRSWYDWFGDRMDLAAIQEKTRETGHEVIVEMKIRGLDKDSLKIDVDGSRIRLACDSKKLEEKKDGNGREIFRSESARHFEKILPVPANADPQKSRIVKEGDVVKIIFDRRQRQSEKA